MKLANYKSLAATLFSGPSKIATFATGLCKTPVSADVSRLKRNIPEVRALAYGRIVAQAVSRWLPIAAADVGTQLRPCGIRGQSDTTAGFLRALGFPYHPSHRLLHTHHQISSGAGTIGQIVEDVPSGHGLIIPQSMLRTADAPEQ
jgi:hypothetical protein